MKKILPSLVFAILAFVIAIPSFAAEVLKENHPDRYVVKNGDSLWGIASMFLRDAWMWPEIWHVNPGIENPHLIFPGDEILLRYVDGEPQLTLRRGDATARVNASQSVRQGDRNTKLEPEIRISPLTGAIPAIPFDKISSMLPTGRIVAEDTLDLAPHILASVSERLVFGPGDSFYARGLWSDQTTIYGVYRKGDIYQDPETREILGYEARELGFAKVIAKNGEIQTFELVSVKEDIRLGDRLMPTEERRVESTFFPKPPTEKVEGVIMNVAGSVIQVGKTDVVVINRGLKHGLDIGAVLAIHKNGGIVRDRIGGGYVELPSERAGVLLVVRAYEKMSYGFVLETKIPLRVGDLVLNP